MQNILQYCLFSSEAKATGKSKWSENDDSVEATVDFKVLDYSNEGCFFAMIGCKTWWYAS